MKQTKRILLSLLAGTVALAMLTACDGNGKSNPADTQGEPSRTTSTTAKPQEEEPEVHTHAPGGWQIDGMNHWRLCACGEVMDKAIHTVKDSVCTGCEAKVYDWEDGTMSIWQCDEQGNAVLKLDYDAEGNLILKETGDIIYNEDGQVLSELYTQYPGGEFPASSQRTEYTYDDDGNCLTEKQYYNGTIYYECEYALDRDGEEYVTKDILYHHDGSRLVSLYDEKSQTISAIWYGVDGKELDHSGKFDAEACKELFGTWKGELDLGDLLYQDMMNQDSPVPDGFRVSCKMEVTMTFRKDGSYSVQSKADPNEYKAMMIEIAVEVIYVGGEQGGMTRAEVDAYFEASVGMSVRQYVEAGYEEDEEGLEESLNENEEGVYYVEKGDLYMGDGWDQPLEKGDYSTSGDTLTLIPPQDETGTELELVLYRVAD